MALARSGWLAWRVRHAPRYSNPSSLDIEAIESELGRIGVVVHDYTPSAKDFRVFQAARLFPAEYHGGMDGGVWDEKLLEHWISSERLGLKGYQAEDIYVDIAAASSPWAQILRERNGISAYAVDIEVGRFYRRLPYYRQEDATNTSFGNASVRGASLQCAYEMFLGTDDTDLIVEAARILKPGGKMVILPLYMHTHYCAYSTAEFYGKGYPDPEAKEYVRLDCSNVPSSRKYDAPMLKRRVLDPAVALGMGYRLFALRNKNELGKNIYCHFILEIIR